MCSAPGCYSSGRAGEHSSPVGGEPRSSTASWNGFPARVRPAAATAGWIAYDSLAPAVSVLMAARPRAASTDSASPSPGGWPSRPRAVHRPAQAPSKTGRSRSRSSRQHRNQNRSRSPGVRVSSHDPGPCSEHVQVVLAGHRGFPGGEEACRAVRLASAMPVCRSSRAGRAVPDPRPARRRAPAASGAPARRPARGARVAGP